MTESDDSLERVLILAPVGRDAPLCAELLGRAKLSTLICRDAEELVARITQGAGAMLLTEEALTTHTLDLLGSALTREPTWSSLPIVLLLSERSSHMPAAVEAMTQHLGTRERVVFLSKPISGVTLVSLMRAALAARARQYKTRDLLSKLEAMNQLLENRVVEGTAEVLRQDKKLTSLSAELCTAEEREHRRIAQVLHDDLQQMLLAVRVGLEVMRRAKDPAKKDELARDLSEVLGRAVEVTRSLTVELAPPVLDQQGLAAALNWLAVQMQTQHHIQVIVDADASAEPASAELRTFLFRAVRELLLNAVKHAEGSPVHITMATAEPSQIRIVVADKGPGFDPETPSASSSGIGGFGLASVRERAAHLGGELRIESAPGHGTRMILLAPLGAPEKPCGEMNDTGRAPASGRTPTYVYG